MNRPPAPGPPPGWGHPQQPPGQWSPYPGGYQPPPPKPNRTPLWIGLGLAVVVVVVLLITGFVAPGFFLSKKKDTASPPVSSPSPSAAATSSAPEADQEYAAPITAFLEALNAKDKAGAMTHVCLGESVLVSHRIDRALRTGTPHFEAESIGLVTRGFANAYLGGTLDGKPLPEEKDEDGITVPKGRIGSNNVGGPWCVDGMITGLPEIDGR